MLKPTLILKKPKASVPQWGTGLRLETRTQLVALPS